MYQLRSHCRLHPRLLSLVAFVRLLVYDAIQSVEIVWLDNASVMMLADEAGRMREQTVLAYLKTSVLRFSKQLRRDSNRSRKLQQFIRR